MIRITEAKTKRELVQFMEFPLKLYHDNSYFVPDILASQVADMQRDKNPAFAYSDARAFLAWKDGKIAGRIAAILNERANEKAGKRYLRFTQLDFIDDDEVVDALFAAVEDWAKALGCEAVHGPLGFSDMDREGLLVEGFDQQSLFYTYYNHPYYMAQLERLGYAKEVDWIELRLTIPQMPDPKVEKLAAYVKQRQRLHVVNLGDKPIRQIITDVFRLWNDTYYKLFGVVAMTDKQVDKYASEFLPLVDKRTTAFIYNEQDEMVAFGVCCPSLEKAMRKIRGRTAPFGWIPLIRALKGKNEQLDMLLISVRPDLQGAAVNAILLDDLHKKAIKAGFKTAETGPMLELNDNILSQWKRYDTEQIKRRRCFVKELR